MAKLSSGWKKSATSNTGSDRFQWAPRRLLPPEALDAQGNTLGIRLFHPNAFVIDVARRTPLTPLRRGVSPACDCGKSCYGTSAPRSSGWLDPTNSSPMAKRPSATASQ